MTDPRPKLLFVCAHNAGRSAMGAAIARHLGGDLVEASSGGIAPDDAASAVTIATLAEIGIDDSNHVPSLLTEDRVRQADVVIAMKPNLPIPQVDGTRYETWSLVTPPSTDAEGTRVLRDDISEKVTDLLDRTTGRNPA